MLRGLQTGGLSFLALGLAAVGCSGSKCAGVTCPAAEACDPTDGQCKCGAQAGADGGIGGTICGPNEICDANLQACVGTLCAIKLCSGGNTCDPQDGLCKCGGVICVSFVCDNTTHTCSSGGGPCGGVACAAGYSCDPVDGKCKCATCPVDPCAGVHCAAADEGNQCIQGVCRCGKNGLVAVDDPVCGRDQHCQDGACVTILGCDAVPRCYGFEVCSPIDLQCHCGSRLATAPVCQPGEICQSYGGPGDPYFSGDAGPGYDGGPFFACRALNDCHQTSCAGGQICDPNLSFNCVCEADVGESGPACQQNQYCIALDTTQPPACLPSCNPYVQQECQLADAGLLYCYAEFLGDAGSGAAVCEAPNPLIYAEGDPCGTNAECGPGLGCWDLPEIIDGGVIPDVRMCRQYCDTGPRTDGGTHDCPPPYSCTPVGQVLAHGELVQIGFCQ